MFVYCGTQGLVGIVVDKEGLEKVGRYGWISDSLSEGLHWNAWLYIVTVRNTVVFVHIDISHMYETTEENLEILDGS